jgi:alkylation response protein AidB-like acyl-CoA dehydrogenase
VPAETVKALGGAGLHALMVPKEVGGGEASIVDCIDTFAEVSRADGSAGWCLMANAATIAFFGAWAGDDFARELFRDGVPLAAGQFAPNGTATPDGDGFRITGDYNFGSGINHSDWIGAGVLTTEDDSRLLMALLPRAEVTMQDGWDVLGLEATASWDYTIRDAWVPDGATFDFFAPVQRRGGAVYELGVLGLTSAGHAGVAIGVVRRALDELRAIATTKARMGASAPLREKESFLIALAGLESRARSAAGWVRDTFATAEATAVRTGRADAFEVALARQSTVHATQDGADVVRDAYLLAGTDALRAGPLQRCFRDMHAATQHFFAGEFATLEAGRALLSPE